jgi:hypothetical protein
MIKQYRIIVADGHGVEPADLWEKRLPPELAAIALSEKRAPLLLQRTEGSTNCNFHAQDREHALK